MSGENIRRKFLYNLPSSVMYRFCLVMDGLSELDWTRFASEVLSDQTDCRLAARKEGRTDWVMNRWATRNGRVGDLLDLLEHLQLLRPRDIILSWTPNVRPPSPPPPPPRAQPALFPLLSLPQLDPPPKLPMNVPTLPTCTLSETDGGARGDEGGEGGARPLPKPAPPPSSLQSGLQQPPQTVDNGSLSVACSGVMCWSYEEVHAGTQGFSPALQVGEGGFGIVYRASIRNTKCAVKKLKKDSPLDWSLLKESFKTEVEKLSQFRHPNIVDLLAFSEDGGSFCLIYSYMENRSLEDQLHNDIGGLSWSQRVGVVEEASTALQFLHCPPHPHTPLIHGDVKSSNILLDRHLVAKLADFGLARFTRGSDRPSAGQTASVGKTMTIRGTLAYLPVEYARNGELGPAVDVFSFGVVLLEVLTGRRALEEHRKPDEKYLKDLAEKFQKDPTGSSAAAWRKLLDPRLVSGGATEPAGCMEMAALACRCLDKRRKKRPAMIEVFDKLQDIHNIVKRNTGCSSSPEHPPHPPSHLHHPIQSFPRPPLCLESSTGALCQQMSRLGPLEDTYQLASTSSSSSSSSSSSASFCSLMPPHPLHSSSSSLPPSSSHPSLLSSSLPAPSSSSSFAGPCETDESQGFSQYYASSHMAGDQWRSPADQTHSRSLSPSTRDQHKNLSQPTQSQFSQPSVPTEDQYNFPLQPSSSDRLGAPSSTSSPGRVCTGAVRESPSGKSLTHGEPQRGVTLRQNTSTQIMIAGNGTLMPPGAQTAEGSYGGSNGGSYGVAACSSPGRSLRSSSPEPSVLMNPSKQRFLEKKTLYEEGRIHTPELLSSDDLYVGSNSSEIRGPEESDELDFLPSNQKME